MNSVCVDSFTDIKCSTWAKGYYFQVRIRVTHTMTVLNTQKTPLN